MLLLSLPLHDVGRVSSSPVEPVVLFFMSEYHYSVFLQHSQGAVATLVTLRRNVRAFSLHYSFLYLHLDLHKIVIVCLMGQCCRKCSDLPGLRLNVPVLLLDMHVLKSRNGRIRTTAKLAYVSCNVFFFSFIISINLSFPL